MTYIANTQRTSQKSQANGYAALDAGTKVPTAELGDSSANISTFFRGDRTWGIPGTTIPITTKTFGDSPYSSTVNDYVILGDCTGGILEIDLPDASSNSGKIYVLKKIDASDNVLHYVGLGGDTIDGDASGNLPVRYDALTIISGDVTSPGWHIYADWQVVEISVWVNVIGGDLNSAKRSFGAFGTNSAGVACGGIDSSFNTLASTETFDGATWTALGAGGDLNTARYVFGSFGSLSAGIACGGDAGGTPISSTETFNGATWTLLGAGGDLNTARESNGAFGISSAGVTCGGYGAYFLTETFNGTTWASLGGGDLNTGRQNFGAFGISSAGVACGGVSFGSTIATTETFNGATWTALGAGGDLNTARSNFGAFGVQSVGVACGGRDSGSNALASTETFNGVIWTLLGAGGDLNTARFDFGAFGISSTGIACGGRDSSFNTLASTEKFAL